MTLVIIGSGPAGLAAAKAFRAAGDDAPVIMITGDRHPPYSRPPLTKDFLRGETELDDLWLTDDGWFADQQIELRTGTTVRAVDVERRTVLLEDGSTQPYDDLVLATGSQPVPLPLPGGDDPELICVRDLDSGHRLRDLARHPGRRVAVIGSGFIGCEAAASLAARGLDVVLISAEDIPHVERLGERAGHEIHRWLRDAGVELALGAPVTRIDRDGERFLVTLEDGRVEQVDAVVVGSGAKPELRLAEDAGLVIMNGGVRVDASMRTSAEHVFAVGDIAYAEHGAANRSLRVEHWGDADQHGEVAGTVAAGATASWQDPPGFWSTIGDHTLKYAAWGDGFDGWLFRGDADSWSIWYRRGSQLAGVLAHEDDDAYERGQQLLTQGVSFEDAIG